MLQMHIAFVFINFGIFIIGVAAVGAEAAGEAPQDPATTEQPMDNVQEETVLPEPNGAFPGTVSLLLL